MTDLCTAGVEVPTERAASGPFGRDLLGALKQSESHPCHLNVAIMSMMTQMLRFHDNP
jgi:hypothetical protein